MHNDEHQLINQKLLVLAVIVNLSENKVPVKDLQARTELDYEKVEHYTKWVFTDEEFEEMLQDNREDAMANDIWED